MSFHPLRIVVTLLVTALVVSALPIALTIYLPRKVSNSTDTDLPLTPLYPP